jgi:peptidoglycan/LPS O-acetylase OafA/YrhL
MKKWQVIDLVRSFSIIVVLADHSYSNPVFNSQWSAWFWGRLCVNGAYGVLLFFFVSGFLITNVIENYSGRLFEPDLKRFYIYRAGRIWPLFFLIFGFGIVLSLVASHENILYLNFFPDEKDYSFWFWFSIPTFMFNWFIAFNPSFYGIQWAILWSLSVEEQFYFFYPFALKKTGNKKRFLSLLASIIFLAVLWRLLFLIYFPSNGPLQWFPFPAEMDLFGMGILLYLTVQHYSHYFLKHKISSIVLCFFGFTLTLFAYFATQSNKSLVCAFIPEALGLGLFAFLLGGLHLSFFETKLIKIFSLPGKYCYASYLLHPIVLSFIHPWFVKTNYFLGLTIFVLITTLVSAASYHFFEMPINRWIRKIFDTSKIPYDFRSF